MKILFFISLVLTLCTNGLQAQDLYLSNYYVQNALPLCPNVKIADVFDKNNGFVCNGSQVKLYYIFEPTVNVTLASNATSGIGFIGYGNIAGSTAMALSYKLYGPFNPNQGYTSLIESNTLTPLISGGPATTLQYLNTPVLAGKHYVLEILATDADCAGRVTVSVGSRLINNLTCPDTRDCESCIPKFQPMNGNYVVTGWVKEQGGEAKTAYTNCQMKVISGSGGTAVTLDIPVSGQIIDGWQRMERDDIPGSTTGEFAIELISTSGECYFDDIRVIPYDGSMVSYVYDPVTMRLIAELDERNYAKVYEYDEEGKLIRVKKETEKGTFTITETKENSSSKEE